jgi:hypothetical protein
MKNKLFAVVLCLATLASFGTASAALTDILLLPPDNGEVISGDFTFEVSLEPGDHATQVDFYWSDDSGATWNFIDTVTNDTDPDDFFTYDWDSTSVPDGFETYWITAEATDGVDIIEDWSENITVDNTAPEILEIASPLEDDIVSGIVDIEFTISDMIGYELEWSASSLCGPGVVSDFTQTVVDEFTDTWTATWDTTSAFEGECTIYLDITDDAGNSEYYFYDVIIDNNAPIITAYNPDEGQIVGGILPIIFVVEDATLDITEVSVYDGDLVLPLACDGPSGEDWVDCSIDWDVSAVADGTPATVQIYANDASGKETLLEINVTVDNTNPVISDILVNSITENSAVITWNTDDLASSIIIYGTNESDLSQAVADLAFVQNHSLTLPSLSASTTYFYQVKSCNQSSACTDAAIQNFTTATPTEPQPEPQPQKRGGGGGSSSKPTNITPAPAPAPLPVPVEVVSQEEEQPQIEELPDGDRESSEDLVTGSFFGKPISNGAKLGAVLAIAAVLAWLASGWLFRPKP